MSLAWSLRGQFGHLKGALIPGVLAAVAAVLVDPSQETRRAFGLSVILSGIGFSVGGHLAYGEAIQSLLASQNLEAAVPELVRISLVGAVWGGIGFSFLGFGLSEKSFERRDLAFLLGLAALWLVPLGLFNLEAFDLALFAAGFLLIHAYNSLLKRSRVLSLLGIGGAIGFGLSFLLAVSLLVAGERGLLAGPWPWWRLRDQILGFTGGLSLWLLLERISRQRLLPVPLGREKTNLVLNKLGFLFFLVFVPGINKLGVFTYWTAKLSFLQALLFDLPFLGALAVFSVFAFRKFIFSTLFFVWYLSVLAIAKEMLVYGLARWEPAYTGFLLLGALLSFLVPFPLRDVENMRHSE
jgi:hypothetical protein